MRRRSILKWIVLTALSLTVVFMLSTIVYDKSAAATVDKPGDVTEGSLQYIDKDGKPAACPLKHTEVKAAVSGFLSRVTVTQDFENPFENKIEAVYKFPLPQAAAVDDLTMQIGERTIKGKIMRREEAQKAYDDAKQLGKIASLLNQERPNIFTQQVANIMPGQRIRIRISYVETLKYEDGAYEWSFPMVVGERYIPNSDLPDNDQQADSSRITPPRATRAGHDISLELQLNAGVPIQSLNSETHETEVERTGNNSAMVRLKDQATIPNKDFVLKYQVAGDAIHDAILAHRTDRGGFFTLILQPPQRVSAEDVMPKELVFVLDTSGSMSGFPFEKARETLLLALDNLYPHDTFNLITFAGETRILFPDPVPATPENVKKAKKLLGSAGTDGGTEMMTAIKAALEPSDSQQHVRIVCFMTDGYVGNDMQIIDEVQKHQNARVFAFGIGSSVNRFLLDNMAAAGRGDVEYVGLNDDGAAAAQRFHQRVRNPLLTDISIDWGGLAVADVYPKRIPDLFGAKPVVVTGRYNAPGSGTIKLKGNMAGNPFTREIQVTLPETMALHDVLAPLWARARIDGLLSEDYLGALKGQMRDDLKNTITQLGIEFSLMTQFTSFVAVEEVTVTDGGTLRRIDVPVDVPAGMDPLVGELRPSGTLSGPTGLFTVYNPNANLGYIAQFNIGRRANAQPTPVPPARRSRGNVKAAAGGGGGIGTGSGAGTGPGTAGNVGGGAPSANASTVNAAQQAVDQNALAPERLLDKSPLTPEEERVFRIEAKFQPTLRTLVDQLKKTPQPDLTNYGGFVRNRKAELKLWLTDKSEVAKAKLKELGFEIVLDNAGSNLVIGRIPIEKLELLADLDFVRYVSAQTSR